MSRKFKPDEIMEVYDLVWGQFHEDRDLLLSQYHELRGLISGSIERYATTGEVLAKYSDQLVKQTGQVLDFLKTIKKETKETETLSEEDLYAVSEKLKK